MKNHNILTLFLMVLMLTPGMMGAQWTEEQKLLVDIPVFIPNGVANDYFGFSVSISGATALIGAYGEDANGFVDSGSAYIFEKSGDSWVQTTKLLPSDADGLDEFGYSVSISGSIAIVGARKENDNGTLSGAAYIFEKNGGTWSQTAKLIASDGNSGDYFGYAVSISGTTALVGSPNSDDNGSSSGAAYIFEKNGGTWTESTKLTALDGALGDEFGSAVSISGNAVLIGAYGNNDDGSNSGSAYVFESIGGTWSQTAKLIADDGAAGDYFGQSVAIDGTTALVGSFWDDANGFHSGSAYVFEKSGGAWAQTSKLIASDGISNDFFGASVSLSGLTAVVGAYGGGIEGLGLERAYIFDKTDDAWIESTQLTASDGTTFDSFGNSVSISGTTVLVGAFEYDDDEGTDAGAAYIFEKSDPCAAPTDLDVVEIGFGTANARVNAIWNNPNGTSDCEVRGGRIAPSSIGTGNPQFANINNTRVITQTDGSTVLFNIVLYNNPNVPFNVGQTYGFEVRCLCEDETEYTNWSGLTPQATFVVPSPPAAIQSGANDEAKLISETVVSVFPNPSNGDEVNLSITGAELENAFIRIMDMNGKLISESRLDRDVKSGIMNMKFDSRLDRGVYMIQVFNETQMINQRFIVE